MSQQSTPSQSNNENDLNQTNAAGAHTDTDYLTITEHPVKPLPNQEHLPFWEKGWIVPELKDLLFKQPEVEGGDNLTPLRTYLIVDAYLYTKVRGFFDLDLINDAQVKCLFKGEAEENMKTVAPYLIDMTLPEGAWGDKNKVPDFHKYYFEKQWHQGVGIFVRSTADMYEIYQHLRKFTKMQDENGKWYFFRFWEPRTFLIAEKLRHSSKSTIVRFCNNPLISKVLAFSAKANLIIQHNADLPVEMGDLRLYREDLLALEQIKEDDFLKQVIDNLGTNHPELSVLTDRTGVEKLYNESQKKGYTQQLASYNYIRTNLLLQYHLQQYPQKPPMVITDIETMVDPNVERSPVERSKMLWEKLTTITNEQSKTA